MVPRGGMHRIALEGRAVAYGRRQEEAVLLSSGEGVWAMAEEGVGAGAAWQDEPKHRSGGGGREVLAARRAREGRSAVVAIRWRVGPARKEVRNWSNPGARLRGWE